MYDLCGIHTPVQGLFVFKLFNCRTLTKKNLLSSFCWTKWSHCLTSVTSFLHFFFSIFIYFILFFIVHFFIFLFFLLQGLSLPFAEQNDPTVSLVSHPFFVFFFFFFIFFIFFFFSFLIVHFFFSLFFFFFSSTGFVTSWIVLGDGRLPVLHIFVVK